MEEQIKRIVKSQKVQYISFWIIPLLLVLLGEAGVLPVGIKADNVRAVYVFETVGILMTAVCIPLSLKLFSSDKENRSADVSGGLEPLYALGGCSAGFTGICSGV